MWRFILFTLSGYASSSCTWPARTAILNLSDKYLCEEPITDFISFLKELLPRTVPHNCNRILLEGRDAIEAANLARACWRWGHENDDVKFVLAAALYECCGMPTDVLLRGVTLEDGDTVKLDEENLVACIEARSRLAQVTLGLFESALFKQSLFGSPACQRRESCKEERMKARWEEAIKDPLYFSEFLNKPLAAREGVARFAERDDPRLCPSCKGNYLSRYDRSTQSTRDKLTIIMGLDC